MKNSPKARNTNPALAALELRRLRETGKLSEEEYANRLSGASERPGRAADRERLPSAADILRVHYARCTTR